MFSSEFPPLAVPLVSLCAVAPFFRFFVARGIAVFILGCLLSFVQLHSVLNRQLSASLQGHELQATVVVLALPVEKGRSVRFVVRVIEIARVGEKYCDQCAGLVGEKIRLSWRRAGAFETLRAGQYWSLKVKLKTPRGFVNPGGFDYQAWLLNQGVSATGYVRSGNKNLMLPLKKSTRSSFQSPSQSSSKSPSQYFASIAGFIEARLFASGGFESEAIMRALLLGDKSRLTPDQWNVFQKTGTTHLMAISGLHIGLVAMMFFIAVRRLIGVIPFALPVIVIRVLPVLFSVVFSGLYAGVSGFAVPSQRAWFIVVFANICYFFGRKINPFRVLLYAAIFVVLLNPLSVTQNGFWLSFTAVFLLVYCFAFRVERFSSIKGLIIAQWVVCVGLSMVLFACVLPMSGLGPVANIVAVPLVSFVVIPALFLAALLSLWSAELSKIALTVADFSLQKLWSILHWLSSIDLNLWFSPFSVWFAVLGFIGCMFVLAPRAFKLQLPGLILIVLVLFAGRSDRMSDFYRMTILDVGQGLSVVIESPSKTMVYDVGAKFSPSFDIGSRVLAPYLRYRNRMNIDSLVISHGDNDHAGGLKGLLALVRVERLFMNQDVIDVQSGGGQKKGENKQQKGLGGTGLSQPESIESCIKGLKWRMDDLEIKVLWPTLQSLSNNHSNNDSCVVWLRSADVSILLTGDIEKTVENELISSGVLPKKVDVLLAPHHGSKTSSSLAFIHAVNARHVIFSSGYLNRYKHPSSVIEKRYRLGGSKAWNTAEHGAITVEWRRDEFLRVFSERLKNAKLWYD